MKLEVHKACDPVEQNLELKGVIIQLKKTLAIQIGNTDDKLGQQQWSSYCNNVNEIIKLICESIYFSGGSTYDMPWQNACWVCDVNIQDIATLKERLTECRIVYKQDSIAIVVGEVEFI